jgi:hypothetical protein
MENRFSSVLSSPTCLKKNRHRERIFSSKSGQVFRQGFFRAEFQTGKQTSVKRD